MGKSSLEAWKFVEGEKQNSGSDDIFMKHSVEFQTSGFTILSTMTLCAEVNHYEMYYVCKASGFERKFGSSRLRIILERFLGRNCLKRNQSGFG